MTSPLDEASARLNYEGKLPADNWLMRRTQGIEVHQESMLATMRAIVTMGERVLQDRVSTDLCMHGASDLENVSPSKELAHLGFGVLPTGAPRRWQGYGTWTPDSAMGVDLRLRDEYDYSNRSAGPRPLGRVGLVLSARTWGRLSEEDGAVIGSVEGAEVLPYVDNGFSRRGTTVHVRRTAEQPLTQPEVETVLAPLSLHIINYFALMGRAQPEQQPPGNFTQHKNSTQGHKSQRHIGLREIIAGSKELLSGKS